MTDLTNSFFHDATNTNARECPEAWPWQNGPVCPHCGAVGEATLLRGKTTRPGLYQCRACREPFTVTVGTLYVRGHIPLNKSLMATHMMANMTRASSLQLHHMLGIRKKSTWYMADRVPESLRKTKLPDKPLGDQNKVGEIDETYVGALDDLLKTARYQVTQIIVTCGCNLEREFGLHFPYGRRFVFPF